MPRRPRALALLAVLAALPAAAQAPARWTLTPDLRIGEESGAEFTFISQVIPAPGGGVLAIESRPAGLFLFDARGALVRRIGRAGDGPGEYRSLGGAGFLGDTLWTSDPQLQRVTLFTVDGRVLRTIPQAPAATGSGPGAFVRPFVGTLLPGDRAVGGASIASSAIADGQVPRRPVLLMTRDGRTLDTIAWISLENSQLALRTATRQIFASQPYGDSPISATAAARERFYVIDRRSATSARGATFGVVALNFSGDTVWSRRYPYTPKPLERDSVNSYVNRLSTTGVGGQAVPADVVREQLYAPAFRAPVVGAVAGDDGSLWLRLGGLTGDAEYMVIAPNGTLAATVTLPRSVTISAITGDVAWGTDRDADDVPSVVRFRIRR